MGHSFGGAVTQILLDRGLGCAGVAIDSAPVKGVLPPPYSSLKSDWPVIGNPANRNKAIALTPKQFHYNFANTLGGGRSPPASTSATRCRDRLACSSRVRAPTSTLAPRPRSTPAAGAALLCCSSPAGPTTWCRRS
ncbi:hypothetical protein AB0N87_18310 [Streptomyces sp. NPDC093228]|uniref:hypothetical protein n=1 Tax=Streptomyces sp. NPDC093228 TaxID=3155070 RepID=UPI00343F864F